MRVSALLLFVLFAACSPDLPKAQRSISPEALAAPYPSLAPIDALLARSEEGSSIELETADLEARVARLKARAAALRGRSVLDSATRLRLLQAARRNVARRNG